MIIQKDNPNQLVPFSGVGYAGFRSAHRGEAATTFGVDE
jgi:hypothetical protein